MKRIPSELLHALEILPSQHPGGGVVDVWCIWSPDDHAKRAAVDAALAPFYPPGTHFCLVQAMRTPCFDPTEWLRQTIEAYEGR